MGASDQSKDVAERIDHGGGCEAALALGQRLVLGCADLLQSVQRPFEVVDVPAGNDAAGALRDFGQELAVDDAELVFIVADSELDIGRMMLVGTLEIWCDAQKDEYQSLA